MHVPPIFLLLCLAGGLAGCASPAGTPVGGPAASPAQTAPAGARRVEWGGTIIAVSNQRDSTELEVLAYPLTADGRPDVAAPSSGRFIAVRPGFLEPADYRPGRLVTVAGPVVGVRQGRVGEAQHSFPAMAAESLRVWSTADTGSRVVPYGTIGIGFGSGYYGSGVGIGIGF
ncbi:MAG: Slp family lipoprotein [Gammaproteobacteria bacterium]|jgi:outer membrane lipoprotein|nr:Slp family lipoprotein [Gammaproteobacteria bacterium]